MERRPTPPDAAALTDYIVCPACDALWRIREPELGGRTTCGRCHHVLIRPRAGAILQVVALGLAVMVLLVGALFLPFLEISVRGFSNASSIFEAAIVFTGPELVWVSVTVVAFIIGIPMARVMLTTYALAPILLRRPVLRGGGTAFRWAESMRPWSMAEIFILGVGVALVKIVDLARVEIGPAFWMFALLVLITLLQDTFTCRYTIWTALESATSRARSGSAPRAATPADSAGTTPSAATPADRAGSASRSANRPASSPASRPDRDPASVAGAAPAPGPGASPGSGTPAP